MGILSRMKTIFKSEVNASLDKAEDTEKMLNQTVLDMQEQLQKAKQQVAIAIADEKRLERSYLENQQLTDQWMDKAKLAVQKGSDELAKAALERKVEYENLAAEYQKQWVAQKDAVEKLKVSLRDLERKVEEAKRQKDLLIARNKRAIAQKQIHQTMAGMATNAGVFNTFDRMKRKVDEFAELGKSSIDDELAKLKTQVSDAPKAEDPELAKLKEEINK
jgi:phage shock protein A